MAPLFVTLRTRSSLAYLPPPAVNAVQMAAGLGTGRSARGGRQARRAARRLRSSKHQARHPMYAGALQVRSWPTSLEKLGVARTGNCDSKPKSLRAQMSLKRAEHKAARRSSWTKLRDPESPSEARAAVCCAELRVCKQRSQRVASISR